MARGSRGDHAVIDGVEAEVFVVPTDSHESDATFAWDETTMVVVHVVAAGTWGIGYTYAHRAAADLARGPLARAIIGLEATHGAAAYAAMDRAVRNIGRPGLAWEAISAVDVALWDLRAKLLDVPLASLLGPARDSVPVYGSGGFTSYDGGRLAEQVSRFADAGMCAVKIKVGRRAGEDVARVELARRAIGDRVDLFVDANGGYATKEALFFADRFAELGVSWFEEPVTSEDLDGLRLLRERGPAGLDIAAGEYGYVPSDFRRMLQAGAVDVLMADVTRCGGITGLLEVAALADAFGIPLSTHCAPLIHAHVGCALRRLRHVEWFYDHARIERMIFDGALEPHDGFLTPTGTRPGLGIELRRADAARFAA